MMLWGLWEGWDVAMFVHSTRAGVTKGSAWCWGLFRADVLALYTVMVSLEAACQGGGTWLWAPYLPGPSWGCAVVASIARRALAVSCFSEPRCSLLGVRTLLGCASSLQLQTSVSSGSPGMGSLSGGRLHHSWVLFAACPGCRQGRLCCLAPVAAHAGAPGPSICHPCPSSPPATVTSGHSPHCGL